jgi:hypothetical protein
VCRLLVCRTPPPVRTRASFRHRAAAQNAAAAQLKMPLMYTFRLGAVRYRGGHQGASAGARAQWPLTDVHEARVVRVWSMPTVWAVAIVCYFPDLV